ncbi:hypothetical protein P9314_09075 [Paenibacillus validus]|uniref:Uncharacterized protein n=1 Tax=Paenibacillus validus TaxID=44253 RepID=A0A7X2Z8K7_9BACL|nr:MULTISPECIES: hypothetical protein [Paenibacillus]MED4600854.1 hypothetical protein [Paenibacillus validus]MED4606626.1 hypothetical protein [Paenibacillus validus]MUG70318.1 hypothetical protein [Paenibacillus validus]
MNTLAVKGNRWRKRLLVFIFALMIFSFFAWYSRTTHTGEVATVVKVNEKNIEIRNLEGRSTVVSLPKGVSKLINENEEYFIQYEKRRWGQPSLISIEPNPG